MSILTCAAWLSTAVILITYAQIQRGHGTRWFDWSNAIGCIPLAVADVVAGALPAAVVSGAFGAIAWYGHLHAWHERRALKRWVEAKHLDPQIKAYMFGERRTREVRAWDRAQELHARGAAEREASGA